MITLLNRFDDENYLLKKEDILEISSYYSKENKIEPYLKDIFFTSDNGITTKYNEKEKIITFNPKNVLEECRRLLEEWKKNYPIDDKYDDYFMNYFYMQFIYRELVHVSQKKTLEEKDKDELYLYLLKISNKLKENKPNIYKKIKKLTPKEREAHHIGLYTAYELMKYTKLPRKETKIMYLEYLKSILSSYIKNKDDVVSPIELLAEIDKNIDIMKINELIKAKKSSETEKMNLGLPITMEEYTGMESNLQKRLVKIEKNGNETR